MDLYCLEVLWRHQTRQRAPSMELFLHHYECRHIHIEIWQPTLLRPHTWGILDTCKKNLPTILLRIQHFPLHKRNLCSPKLFRNCFSHFDNHKRRMVKKQGIGEELNKTHYYVPTPAGFLSISLLFIISLHCWPFDSFFSGQPMTV